VDAIVPDRPVSLPNRDGHSSWVNSTALDLAGITRDTPDPADGRIERDDAGEPFGTMHEGAQRFMTDLIPPSTPDELYRGLLKGQEYLHALGITGWQDAIVQPDGGAWGDSLGTYLTAADKGELTARVVGALWWDRL